LQAFFASSINLGSEDIGTDISKVIGSPILFNNPGNVSRNFQNSAACVSLEAITDQ